MRNAISKTAPKKAAAKKTAAAKKSAKQNRCWPGYEPVPGKPEHSQGSCRPEPKSKVSPSEKKFRNERDQQLDEWQKKHPGSPRKAAQHLKSPAARKKKA